MTAFAIGARAPLGASNASRRERVSAANCFYLPRAYYARYSQPHGSRRQPRHGFALRAVAPRFPIRGRCLDGTLCVPADVASDKCRAPVRSYRSALADAAGLLWDGGGRGAALPAALSADVVRDAFTDRCVFHAVPIRHLIIYGRTGYAHVSSVQFQATLLSRY